MTVAERIAVFLRTHPDPRTPSEIATGIGVGREATAATLRRMATAGVAVRVGVAYDRQNTWTLTIR